MLGVFGWWREVFTLHGRSSPNGHLCCVLCQVTMYGANVIVFEGIMAFVDRKLRDLMDLKVFVDTDSDIRLARR